MQKDNDAPKLCLAIDNDFNLHQEVAYTGPNTKQAVEVNTNAYVGVAQPIVSKNQNAFSCAAAELGPNVVRLFIRRKENTSEATPD